MLIGFASTQGGCAHYRAELPARMLAALGHFACWTDGDLIFGSEGGMGFDTTSVRFPGAEHQPDPGEVLTPDVVVLAAGWVRAHPEVIKAAARNGQRIVADCDDWPWLPPENPHVIADAKGVVHTWNDGNAKLATMAAADACVVSTSKLGQLCGTREIPFTVCRNGIDPGRYLDPLEANMARAYSHRGPVVIAYRGMTCGFHDADVATLRGILPTEGVRYVHVGDDPRGATFAELTGLPDELVERRQAVEFENYPALLAGVDLALIPFAHRDFSEAKSNIAGLEWTAAGVPWLASRNQAEYQLLDAQSTCASPKDWATRVAGLADDPAWRHELLRRQRVAAAPYSDLAGSLALDWERALSRVLATATGPS